MKHVYFSGIGGAGLSPLALIAKQAGYRVSGSDKQDSDYIKHLRAKGINNLHIGQTKQAITALHTRDPIDWVVYTSAIPKENPNKLVMDRSQFLSSVRRVAIFANKTTHQIRLKIAGAELNISAEDIDYSNKAEERLTCDYQGDDMQIGFNSRFLTEMLTNLQSDEIQLEMSLPNRAGILTPVDGLDEGETVTMLVMPVMLNN